MAYRTAFATLLVAAAAATAAPALADPGGKYGSRGSGFDFEAIDTDASGDISRAELEAHATIRVGESDTDGDGQLSRAEIIAAVPVPDTALRNPFSTPRSERIADRLFERMGAGEADQVAVVDLVEMQSTRMLDRMDRNDDDVISAEEAAEPRGRHGRMHRGPDRQHRG